MKLHESNNIVESNMPEMDTEFTIQASHKAFKILSDNLYTDKITAVIRELSTNGLDAMSDAGNDGQIEVHLPTDFEPTFSVQDFGTGMDEAAIHSLYTSYFSSSKTDRNDQIGALGLGSKSPFSYTDSFNITSIKDGIKGIYTCYLGTGGTPSIKRVFVGPTEAGNGTKIEIAVAENDFRTFTTKSIAVYWNFEACNRPKITGNFQRYNSRFAQLEQEVKVNTVTDEWTLYDVMPDHLSEYGGSTKLKVKMGNIIYPVAKKMLTPDDEELSAAASFALSNAFIVNVPLGTCDIAPSREALNYDEATIFALTEILEKLGTNFQARISKQIAFSATKWEAIIALKTYVKSVQNATVLGIEYKGEDITSTSTVYAEKIVRGSMNWVDTSHRIDRLGRSEYDNRRFETSPAKNIVFVKAEKNTHFTGTSYRRQIKMYLADTSNPYTKLVLMDMTTPDSVFDELGNPPVMSFSDLPKAPSANTYVSKAGKTVAMIGTGTIAESGYYSSAKPKLVVTNEITLEELKKTVPKRRVKPFIVKKGQALYFAGADGTLIHNSNRAQGIINIFSYAADAGLDDGFKEVTVIPHKVFADNLDYFSMKNNWCSVNKLAVEVFNKAVRSYKKNKSGVVATVMADIDIVTNRSNTKSVFGGFTQHIKAFNASDFSADSLFGTKLGEVTEGRCHKYAYNKMQKIVQLDRKAKLLLSAASKKVIDQMLVAIAGGQDSSTTTVSLYDTYPMIKPLLDDYSLRREGSLATRMLSDSGNVSYKRDSDISVLQNVIDYVNMVDMMLAMKEAEKKSA